MTGEVNRNCPSGNECLPDACPGVQQQRVITGADIVNMGGIIATVGGEDRPFVWCGMDEPPEPVQRYRDATS